MIRFRSYVVTLVAVFLALATGVALGGGPLSDLGRHQEPAPAAATTTTPHSTYADTFAGAVAGHLYAGGLAHRPVALVTLPGAPASQVTALGREIRAAGGQVVATYAVTSQLVDPGQRSLVDTLGSQLATQLKGRVDPKATTYPRIGQLLGIAVATTGRTPRQPGAGVGAVRQSLVAARLLTVPRGAPRTAPLALVVTGDAVDQTIFDGLLQGLAARSRGVVAVGTGGDADLQGLHTDGVTAEVAAVDGTETGAGRIAAVLALIRSWRTPGGSFGASGADAAVPLG